MMTLFLVLILYLGLQLITSLFAADRKPCFSTVIDVIIDLAMLIIGLHLMEVCL